MELTKTLITMYCAVGLFHAMGGLRDVQFIAIGIAALILALGYYAEKICYVLKMTQIADDQVKKQEESIKEVD